jgi:hypothetical protein
MDYRGTFVTLNRMSIIARGGFRVVVERATSLVVGSVNLKGPPDGDGDVEVGWGISESHVLMPGWGWPARIRAGETRRCGTDRLDNKRFQWSAIAAGLPMLGDGRKIIALFPLFGL